MTCDACNRMVEYREQHLHRCPAMIVDFPMEPAEDGASGGGGGEGEEQPSVPEAG